jgi:DNA-binding MurR/RpiR family transcriptional regulator
MTPRHVHALIDQRFDQLSPELQRAARWVRQHPVELGMQSMRHCAAQAGVAPATMTRLAQALAFDGYEALRAPFRKALAGAGRDSYVQRARQQQQRAGTSGSEALVPLVEAQRDNLMSVSELNAPDTLDAAADLLLSSGKVLFLGLRASFSVAHHLHYTYALLAANGALAHDLGGALTDQIAQLGSGDLLVAISQSPYTRQTVEAVEQATARGVPVLALTDAALSPIARQAQQTLLFRCESPSFFQSSIGALALVEAIVARVAVRGQSAALARLAAMQSHLQSRQVYWERHRKKASP